MPISFALRIALTPLLITAVSLVSRRWGSTVSGWLVALPLTSTPIIAFIALDSGPTLGADVAAGSLAGVAAVSAFCVAYARTARLASWPLSATTAGLAFGLIAVIVPSVAPILLVPVSLSTVALGLLLLPASHEPARGAQAYPVWDLPLRAFTATLLVIAVTELAPIVGGRLSGVIATYPVYVSVLAVFAHRTRGVGDVIAVLRGVLLGLFGLVGFFFVLATLLRDVGLLLAFGAALAALLGIHGLILAFLRSVTVETPAT